MNLVHTVATLRADHGGPSRSVPALCAELAARGDSVHLVTTEVEGPVTVPDGSVRHIVTPAPGIFAAHTGRSAFSRAVASALGGRSSVVHDHGIWLPTNHAAARIARRHRVPRLVSVRGMLTDWALMQRRWTKAIAWRLYQRADLASAAALHVTSEDELAAMHDLRLAVPVALIPNGVDVPPASAAVRLDRQRRALFLSRLHPGKGAMELVRAWSEVRPDGWQLTVAGPDVGGQRADLEEAVTAAGLDGQVAFTGSVDDAEKWRLYGEADLFVLPTRSENFGLSIAEALASGVPVITTRGAPWSELETHRCGWWIDLGVEPLSQALREATSLSPERRAEMGRRGRRLVEERYAWSRVAERMMAVYDWLLSGGNPPHDVRI